MSATERLPWNSGAHVDGTTFALLVDAARLQRLLDPIGVVLGAAPDVPAGRHPVVIDLWRIVSGRIETAGIDQHTWSTATGAAALAAFGGVIGAAAGSGQGAIDGAAAGAAAGAAMGPVGWWCGAMAGLVAGGASGGAMGFASGVAQGVRAGAGLGEGVSRRMSRTFGTYEEVLVAAPYARVRGRDAGPYMFVLGMRSNGPVSIWGDRALRFGYRKGPAEIVRDGFERYDVVGEVGACTSFVAPPVRWGAIDGRLDRYRALLTSQPLLGPVEGGGFAVTLLDRFFDASDVRWAPVSARLTVGPGFVDGVPEGEFALEALGGDCPWGAFQVQRLPVKVTFPRSLGGFSES